MTQRETYRTKQKACILAFMADHRDSFCTVDEVHTALVAAGHGIGRTTVYRTLEAAAREGSMAKVAGIKGDAAHYRLLTSEDADQGQLICTTCGHAVPLDCTMLQSFCEHVNSGHGFAIDRSKTALYGTCSACQEKRV